MTAAIATTTTAAATSTINSGLSGIADNYQTFLSLLTTQLKNQDPTSPLDTNSFTQQLVQMTGVQQQLLSNTLLKQLVTQSGGSVTGAVDLIGTFEQSPALTLLTGVVAYAVGVAIVLTHRVWTDPLAIVVSLTGWIAALEGLLLIAWPAPLWSLGRTMLGGSGLRISLIFTLVLGALLILAGMTGTAGRIH